MIRSEEEQQESLSGFLRRLWRGKFYITCGLLAGIACGSILIFTLQPHYSAEMIVAPSALQSDGDSLGSFERGRDIGAQDSLSHDGVTSEYVQFEQILRSPSVAKVLAKYDGVIEQVAQDRIFEFYMPPPLQEKELSLYLQRHVRIEPVAATASRRISYAHPDPAFAEKMLNYLHIIADTSLRQKAAAETEERIAWLQRELAKSVNPEHRTAMTELLMRQERKRMLTSMSHPFAASIVEPPSASPKPSYPSKVLVLIVCVFAGAFLGFSVYSVRQTI